MNIRNDFVERGNVALVTGTDYPVSKVLSYFLESSRVEEEQELASFHADIP